jgi:predicted nucleotidyltransferase
MGEGTTSHPGVEWPQLLAAWITPRLTLRNWHERIGRVEAQETAHFASLPHVRGLAVIGSVGRGTHWPISDVDLLVVAYPWEGKDAENLIRVEEDKRNLQLHAAGIPNEVEAANWVLTPDDIASALNADEDGFFRRLEHPHWLWIVIKSEGARIAYDPEGLVGRFLDRCKVALASERFARLWLGVEIGAQVDRLEQAIEHAARGDWSGASLSILSNDGSGGWYALWRRLPQSISRGVSRFLAAAEEMGEHEIGELFLEANRLSEDDTWCRFASVPAAGQRERDVWLAVRHGAGETIDELGATRDLLHVSLKLVIQRGCSGLWPGWTGVTADEAPVRAQFEAAEELVRRLRSAKMAPEGVPDDC